jgi:opacity protein-like surface antigen
MITRQGNVARALSASVAACALVVAASGGAGAQSASADRPAALPVKAPPLPAAIPAWEGLYGGFSFGPAWLRAATSTASRPGFSQTETFAGLVAVTNSATNSRSSASGANVGAQSDIFLGYNFRLGSNVIAGWQVEGTIANTQAQLAGSTTSLTNRTLVVTPPGSITSGSTLSTASFIDNLAERWAVSALGRVGVLIDPRDLVYLIGGYTYGGFDWGGRPFGLHGATVGAGWEREIAPGWTFKAEYRYTRFQDKDLPRSTSSTSNDVTVSPFGTATSVINSSSAITDRVSGLDLHALRFGITHYFNGGPPVVSAYAMATKSPPLLAMPWEGAYSGVSYGPASIRASTSVVSRSVNTQVVTSAAGAVQTSNSVTDSRTNGSGSGWGAQSDVYLGYNFRLGGNLIAGVQAEGTIAENQLLLNAAQTSVANRTTVTVPPGTTTTQQTTTTITFADSLAERWAVSALGRVGWLVDPRDLIYVIGGYTYGGFNWGSRSFGLHGATVGGGWEREVAPGWTLKAEYRYTQFQDKDMPRSSSSSSNTTNVNAGGGISTTVSNTNAAITDRVSGVGSHALRFGLTHYFGGGAPTVTANAAATRGAPPPAWTGLYGGVSFGLTSMHTSTASTFNDVFNATQTAPGFALTDVQTANAAFNTAGQHHGAVGDIFVGYSAALGANVIAGVQAEGSIAHATTLGNGSFVQVTTITDVQTPPGGAAGTITAAGTSTGTTTFAVRSRWMASALGRLGWLVDPRHQVYAIGGWTYGGFSAGIPFDLHGPTIGVGIEREVARSWTVKVEYRYTHFFAKDVSFSQTVGQNLTLGTTTLTSNDVFNETDRIAVRLHALRFGITRYFDSM